MAKSSRNLVNGSGTVSTTLDSEVLTFSANQNFKPGAAVVVGAQQFTVRDGSGTIWLADQRATATVSTQSFTTSDTSTSRAKGSGPLVVLGMHYEYESPVDDTGAADAYRYFDTLDPDQNGRHPFTGDVFTGQNFFQPAPPGDYGVPPRFRWWDDFATRMQMLQYASAASGPSTSCVWVNLPQVDDKAGRLKFLAVAINPPTLRGDSWTPFGGKDSNNQYDVMFRSFRLAKRPVLHARWACRVGGSSYAPPWRRIGFMTIIDGTYDAEPSDGVYFRHQTTGTIKAVARQSNTETVLDTGVSVADGVMHMCQLISRMGGTAVEVWVDAVMKGLLTTNLPSPTTDLYCIFSLSSGNFATEGFDLDYYYVEADRP